MKYIVALAGLLLGLAPQMYGQCPDRKEFSAEVVSDSSEPGEIKVGLPTMEYTWDVRVMSVEQKGMVQEQLAVTTDAIFTDLSPGRYLISISAEEGCRYSIGDGSGRILDFLQITK
ncbi:MAG TPA: hypothetical protein DCE41_17750 [Cytophagales bacterium]|nr:hypothetical protein [Cytophagales bacterium]